MAASRTRLFLVRHGEVDANVEYRFIGRRDAPLNANGIQQAVRLAELFRELEIQGVSSSPLERTVDTARAIAGAASAPLATDERLLELDFGSWEGLTRQEIGDGGPDQRELLDRWDGDPSVPAPGGESLVDLQRRVVAYADELGTRLPGGVIVVVSHMGPIKALLCAALGLPLAGTRRIFLDPATVSVVDWGAEPVVRLVNSHAHLGWTSARWLRPAPGGGRAGRVDRPTTGRR